MAWLGTSGWRLSAGDHTLLVDPYLTRFPVGLAAGRFDPTTRLRVDEEAVARAVGTPRTVLVTHTHWDHFNDVPHIATTHGARLFGTTTATQLALSYGVPAAQLAPVKGGEVLDLGEFVVRVVAGLHSRTAGYSILFPGTRLAPPPRPSTISDLPEGDTLAFLVHRPQGPRVFLMGASDFDDTALGHLEPDVAAVAVPSTRATHEYVPRLLEALGRPRLVIPVHWDNFESPLQNPPRTAEPSGEQLHSFVAEVRRVAPATRVLLPKYLERLRLL
jgi:L-ascorbate metabolism protein UlaG (beta-lactamase superfamily)